MTKFLEKVADFLTPGNYPVANLHEIRIEFVENKSSILEHIERCKRSHGVVGIYSSVLGQGMFLAAVHDIYKLGVDILVELKPYHFGAGLQKVVTISMKDIKYICPFNQQVSQIETDRIYN